MTPAQTIRGIVVLTALMLPLGASSQAQDAAGTSPKAETTGVAPAEANEAPDITTNLYDRLDQFGWQAHAAGVCGVNGFGPAGPDLQLLGHCRMSPFAGGNWQARELEHVR